MSKSAHRHLPAILAEIADAAGFDAALKIAQAKGGTRAYFPARPDPEHWLSQLVGIDKAGAIGQALATGRAGAELEVPMGPSVSQARRWRLIFEMAADKRSKPEIARALGIHHKTVQRVLNNKRRTVERILAQRDLFD